MIKIKKRLIIDVDGVITNTMMNYCALYNILYEDKKGFVPADWHKVRQYDMKDQCPLVPDDEIEDMFNIPQMYTYDSFMPDAIAVVNRLSEKYNIEIATIGMRKNLINKYKLLTEYLFIDTYHGIDVLRYKDKSHIDMSGAIFIDDVAENLETSNAEKKICFGKKYPWNESWTGLRCKTWDDVLAELM